MLKSHSVSESLFNSLNEVVCPHVAHPPSIKLYGSMSSQQPMITDSSTLGERGSGGNCPIRLSFSSVFHFLIRFIEDVLDDPCFDFFFFTSDVFFNLLFS